MLVPELAEPDREVATPILLIVFVDKARFILDLVRSFCKLLRRVVRRSERIKKLRKILLDLVCQHARLALG
jgi:hypothetical protein